MELRSVVRGNYDQCLPSLERLATIAQKGITVAVTV
jgi:hypothetical protein